MARKRVDGIKTFTVVVRFDDARAIRKLESRLWRYGKIQSSIYAREEDEWGRPFIKIAMYSLDVPRSKLSLIRHSLSKLEQQNGFEILYP